MQVVKLNAASFSSPIARWIQHAACDPQPTWEKKIATLPYVETIDGLTANHLFIIRWYRSRYSVFSIALKVTHKLLSNQNFPHKMYININMLIIAFRKNHSVISLMLVISTDRRSQWISVKTQHILLKRELSLIDIPDPCKLQRHHSSSTCKLRL